MNRRLALIGCLVLVVLAATYSTARARQVESENQARSLQDAALRQTSAAMAAAAADGLLRSELRPYHERLAQIQSAIPPSALPFWSPGVDRFYRRQASRYRSLTRQVRAAVRRVTKETRGEAVRAVESLDREIARARELDLNPEAASRVERAERLSISHARFPRDLRSIPTVVRGVEAKLRAGVTARSHYVSSVLAQAGGARDGVLLRVSEETAAAEDRLPLLGLLTARADGYRATLSQLASRVRAQPTARLAAVKEFAVHREVTRVAEDYNRTVPSKLIVVTTEGQSATLYQDGRPILSTPVTTGGPELPTDHGVFHIYTKISPFTFHSPWPEGSPYYYPPTDVQYWMPFDGGEGLHDASWRSNFGPGSNLQPTDLGTGNYILGTHGCVNMPLDAAGFVWNWAPVGTTVVVI